MFSSESQYPQSATDLISDSISSNEAPAKRQTSGALAWQEHGKAGQPVKNTGMVQRESHPCGSSAWQVTLIQYTPSSTNPEMGSICQSGNWNWGVSSHSPQGAGLISRIKPSSSAGYMHAPEAKPISSQLHIWMTVIVPESESRQSPSPQEAL